MNAHRDDNRVPVALGVSSIDGVTPVEIYANPITGAMLIEGGGSGTGDVIGPPSSTDNAVARYDGITGKIIQNSGVTISDTNEIDGATTFNFDILYSKTGSEPIGTMYWNETDGTIDMRLKNGATLQTGQELHFYGKASGDILNGELCQFAGVQGDHILIKKVVASEIIAFPQYLVGVATQGIANGDFGYVTWFGKVNGVYTDTPNNNDSVDWVAGDILYFSNSTGQLTKTQPSAPNRNIVVAAVVREQTGASETGILLIRPTFGSKLADCDDVDGANPDATGDLLSWNNTSQTWDRNTYNITDYALTSSVITDHNELTGLQGGTTDEYYHLTSADYTGQGTGLIVRKSYVDAILGNDNALVYKGVIDCSSNPNYPAADAGFLYIASVAGKIGGASGVDVETGDMILCNTDGTASGDQATVGAYWNVIQKNIIGAVTGPASSTDSHVAMFDGATGKVIKDSGLTLSGSNTGDQDLSGYKTNSMSTEKLLGRSTSGTGVIEEITLGTNLSFDGTTLNATGGGREVLSATRTYYVRTDGNDSNDGLTNTAGGAFLTIQKAIDTVSGLDQSIYAVTIQVADGTYNEGLTLKDSLGSGSITIQGNIVTPANVLINSTATTTITCMAQRKYMIYGVKLQTTTSGNTLFVTNQSLLILNKVHFGAASGGGWHTVVNANSVLTILGSYTISGNAGAHYYVSESSFLNVAAGITITLTGTPYIGYFAFAQRSGFLTCYLVTFSGGATGTRYYARLLGGIDTNGGPANYFPGSVAGTTATGGIYA